MSGTEQWYLWGLFYYNKEDTRLFVPKRIWWMGFTLNFANPLSYIFIAAIAILLICSALLEQ